MKSINNNLSCIQQIIQKFLPDIFLRDFSDDRIPTVVDNCCCILHTTENQNVWFFKTLKIFFFFYTNVCGLKIQFQNNVFLVLFIFTLLRIIVRLVIAKKMYQYIFSRLKQRNQNRQNNHEYTNRVIVLENNSEFSSLFCHFPNGFVHIELQL